MLSFLTFSGWGDNVSLAEQIRDPLEDGNAAAMRDVMVDVLDEVFEFGRGASMVMERIDEILHEANWTWDTPATGPKNRRTLIEYHTRLGRLKILHRLAEAYGLPPDVVALVLQNETHRQFPAPFAGASTSVSNKRQQALEAIAEYAKGYTRDVTNAEHQGAQDAARIRQAQRDAATGSSGGRHRP